MTDTAPTKVHLAHLKVDLRPPKGSWAPGDYFCRCSKCGSLFLGDKRALACADCAYCPATEG